MWNIKLISTAPLTLGVFNALLDTRMTPRPSSSGRSHFQRARILAMHAKQASLQAPLKLLGYGLQVYLDIRAIGMLTVMYTGCPHTPNAI